VIWAFFERQRPRQ